tara:strand:+ start:247 stop:429 length:183 start_codon:yes stop_codon:yes gene_type:complete
MGYPAYIQSKNESRGSKTTNISALLKKNKIEKKKDKIFKAYALLASFFGMMLVFGLFIYL